MVRTLLLLGLLATACSAASLASVSDFLKTNADTFSISQLIYDKAGALSGNSSGTYFLSSDYDFYYALSDYLDPKADGSDPELKDAVAAVKSKLTDTAAKAFVAATTSATAFKNVTALTLAPVKTKGNGSFEVSTDPLDGYTSIGTSDGALTGSIAGPFVIPVGDASIFVVTENVLTDVLSLIGKKPGDVATVTGASPTVTGSPKPSTTSPTAAAASPKPKA